MEGEEVMCRDSDIDLDELVEQLREKQEEQIHKKYEWKNINDHEGAAWHAGLEEGYCVAAEMIEDMRQDSDTSSTKVVCPWCMEGFASEQEWADAFSDNHPFVWLVDRWTGVLATPNHNG